MQFNQLAMKPIAAACALLMLSAGAKAQTQKSDEPPTTITVTGIRGSIESSMAVKRNSDSIVEAVTAEDIGKLPDVSIAESISRLAGLTAQRVEGRAQVISIRGLAPDFSGTLMNGRELVSTSDNRGAEYDQYPSELINGVTVYKTPDASLMGQGLSGTVDLQTVRPLDRRGRTIVINARAEKNSNGALNAGSKDTGNRMSVSYIDQYLDNTLGLAIGFAHLDSPGQQREYKSWWWGGDNNGLPPAVIALKGAEVTASSRDQKRDGLMAVLDFKPFKNFRTSVDLYYSEFAQDTTMRGMMWNSHQWSNVSYANPVISTVGGTQVVTSGSLVHLEPIDRNDFNTRRDKVGALGWNSNLKLQDWNLDADLSYSKAKRREQVLETYAGLGAANSGITDDNFKFQIPTGAGLPTFTPSLDFADRNNIKLADVGGWGKDADMHRPVVDDCLRALKLSAKRNLDGFFSSINAGVNYSVRDKTHFDTNNYYSLKNNHAPVTVDPSLIVPTTSLSFAGLPGPLSYNTMAVLARYYDQQPARPANDALNNWGVKEKQLTGFAKLSIDTDLSTVPLRGNLGLQVINMDQSADGVGLNGTVATPIHDSDKYSDVLPSANLIFDLNQYLNGTTLRFGLAKTLARPRMADMRAGASAGVDPTTRMWNGNGGNPHLKPWRANAIDLSLEKYISKSSYIAGAVWYKKLASYVYNQQTAYDFGGFPNPGTVIPLTNMGTLNRPANGEGGMVRGLELSGSLDAGLLWEPLSGFGVVASASSTESSIHPNGPGTKEKLPGLSGVVSNVTLFYEKNGFSARISQRYRSAYRGEVTGLYAQRAFSEILAEKQIDFQTGYSFEQGELKGLGLLLQVNNLNNSPYQTRQGDPFTGGSYAPERYTTYGRQLMLGMSYKM